MAASNSMNKAETGTEVVSLAATYLIHQEAVIKNETEGAEGISKFSMKLCSPMQEALNVYIAPKHLQNSFGDPMASP